MARFKGSGSASGRSEVSGMDRSDLYSLKREVDQLQSIVMHLLHCLANNEKPDLNQSVIREALYLPKEGEPSEVRKSDYDAPKPPWRERQSARPARAWWSCGPASIPAATSAVTSSKPRTRLRPPRPP